MIISRTPLRVSFVGGGSDLSSFYEEFGGAVLSTAINKYVFVTCNRKFDSGIRVSYSKTEEVERAHEIEHPLIRSVLGLLQLEGGVEITTIADIPSRGTGLGSSSSFTVGLLNVLHAFSGRHVSATRLAEESCHVEIDLCGEPIGRQDQYAASFGGFNLIEFQPDGRVDVSPVTMAVERRKRFSSRLIAFYTGITRSASNLLATQAREVANNKTKQAALRRMVDLTYIMRSSLVSGSLDDVGPILDENWQLKKSLAGDISSAEIEAWYEAARKAGASGGKLLGAGGGGFLLFYVEDGLQDQVAAALPNLRRFDFSLEPLGSRIIFYEE
jgi:D-glycero-alpha-D-manno-heptose-7-phosphate kinase